VRLVSGQFRLRITRVFLFPGPRPCPPPLLTAPFTMQQSSPARSYGSGKPSVNLLELLPDEVVNLALAVLKEARIAFVEQRSRLYRRMGVPVPVKVCYLVMLLS
jgi:hypothetical protein